MSEPLRLTGERTLPGIPEENYWFRRHEAAYAFVRRLASGRVLEVGCGEGYGTALLGAVGLEYDPEVAAHARRTYGIPVGVADACHLPVRERSADCVVSLQVLEHLYCADRFVAACRAALRPGGTFVLSTPNRPVFSPGGALNPFHVYEYDAEELAALLRAHFERVEVLGLRHGRRLRAWERRSVAGGSLPRALIEAGYEGLTEAARSVAGRVRAEHFRIDGRRVGRAHDLVAVCR